MTLRAAFMGSPDFAVPSLLATARACDLRVVVSQPDRPAGRGRKLLAPAVKREAEKLDVPILQPTKVRDGTLAAALREHDLDVIVVTAYGRILPEEILELPEHGCINVHASLLPRWRGAAPIQRAVLAGDAETGAAIMRMDAGMDTGPVYRMRRTPIDPHETSGELAERLSTLGGDLLEEFLRELPGVAAPTEQDHEQATHAAKLEKKEGVVDWSRPVAQLVNHVRGMDPWPAATTRRDDKVLKLFTARATDQAVTGEPGTVVSASDDGLLVNCGDGVLRIEEIQPPGKRRMSIGAYVSGNPLPPGTKLG